MANLITRAVRSLSSLTSDIATPAPRQAVETVPLDGEAMVKASGPSVPNIGSMFQLNAAALDSREITDPLTQHLWVYACSQRIIQALNALPLRTMRGPFEKPEEAKDPELMKLMEYPSPQVKIPGDLWALTLMNLDSTGKCFWVKVKNEGQIINLYDMPDKLIVVGGSRMKPIIRNGWLVAWNYINGKESRTLLPQEVVFFSYPDPNDPWGGLSPLTAAMNGINTDWLAQKYSDAFFKNAGAVSGVLEFAGVADDEVLRQFKRRMREEYGGARNAHKIMVLEQATKYTDLKLSQKDMDFIEQRKWHRDEIIAAFNCNKHALGLTDDYNKANSNEAEKSFHTRAVRPRGLMLCATLWGQWLRWRREQTWLWFDDSNLECMQADRASQAQTATTLMNLGVPLEEINRVLDMGLDLSNNPYAKTIWMSRGFIPAELAATGFSEAMPPATGDEIKTIVREAIAKESAKRKAIAKSEDKPRIPAKLFSEDEFFKDLEEILGPFYDDAVLAGIKQLESEGMAIGFDPDESVAFEKFFKGKWNKVKTIPKRFHAHMKRTIGTQIGNGRTVAEIAKELEERFPISEKGWSMTIARTEVGDVIDGTRYLSMQEEEIPYHAWASAGDAAVRPGHDERDWTHDWVEIGKPFPNGLKYPHDPAGSASDNCNCRCATFPLMEKPGKAKVSGPDEWTKRVKPGIVKLERRVYKALLPVYDKLLVKIIAAMKAAN